MRLLFFIALLGCHGATAASSSDNAEYRLYLTNRVENNQPTSAPSDRFDCADRIYLVVEATDLAPEKHELTDRWLDPAGDRKELTHYQFNGFPSTRVWAWLQLHGPTSAVIGQIFDPSFGMEDFIGRWVADVSVNKKRIGKLEFDVLC